MLKKLKIHNFKCLVDFEIDLQPFTILIGPNASGKSTILQAIDLMKWFGEGNPEGFLKERGWEARDIRSKLTRARTTNFSVRFELENTPFQWKFKLHFPDVGDIECTSEHMGMFIAWASLPMTGSSEPRKITIPQLQVHLMVLRRTSKGIHRLFVDKIVNEQKIHKLTTIEEIRHAFKRDIQQPLTLRQIKEATQEIPPFSLNGSVLSLFRMNNPDDWEQFPLHGIIRKYLEKFHSLELLSPEHLRKKSRMKQADIGITGKYLAAFLDGLPQEQREILDKHLKKLYGRSRGVLTLRERAGWTKFFLKEPFYDEKSGKRFIKKVPAQHISDGILRIIAILAALEGLDDGSTILIDEIENGIYPDLAHGLITAMLEIAKKKNIQIITTTHSPAILNSCPEESVVFVWRDDEGKVKAEPLFENPKMKEQLEYMSPGAVWHTSTRKQIISTLEKQHARKMKEKTKGNNKG